jgi:hypothetical protein
LASTGPAPARTGQSLALQIGSGFDRRILADQDGLRARLGAGASDRLDRRTGGVHRQEGQIAGIADIERAGVQGLEDRGRRGKLRPLDLVRQIAGEPGNLQQRAIAAFLIADPKRDGVRGQRRRHHRQSQCCAEQRSAGVAKARAKCRCRFDCFHAGRSFWFG